MSKSTIFFCLLSSVLAGALGSALWWLGSQPESSGPLPGVVDSLHIGLPVAEGQQAGDSTAAASALVWDTDTGVILFAEEGFERRPIASITKLMTAMVALDIGIDWKKEMTINPEEYVIGGQLLLHNGERVTTRDLFHASLLGSANNATLALVRSLGVGEREFIHQMNRKAIELGFEQTEFVDVTGLDSANLSTAYEVARLAEVAFRDYPLIAEATAREAYTFTAIGSGREHTIKNTNKLITEHGLALAGGKTGYLYEAQYCLVVQSGDQPGRVAVVLGSPSEDDSVQTVKSLLQSAYGRL
jgi:D-alanyl-D-alanine endopeptidase (penicillin-binding protein 7)